MPTLRFLTWKGRVAVFPRSRCAVHTEHRAGLWAAESLSLLNTSFSWYFPCMDMFCFRQRRFFFFLSFFLTILKIRACWWLCLWDVKSKSHWTFWKNSEMYPSSLHCFCALGRHIPQSSLWPLTLFRPGWPHGNGLRCCYTGAASWWSALETDGNVYIALRICKGALLYMTWKLFFEDLCVLLELQGEKESERQRSFILVHPPNGLRGHSWANLKLGASSGLPRGEGPKRSSASSPASPGR